MERSTMPRCGLGLLIFSLMFLACMPAGGSFEKRIPVAKKADKFSVLSLFNLKGRSKFWSETILRGAFEDLETSDPAGSGKMALLNYTKAGTIAAYLKMSQVDAIYLPIPINFIFVGFEGKGNQEFKLGPEELERWFTKIDHVFEHTRIPQLGEALTPFYRVRADGIQRHHLPLISSVNYNFSVHAIEMSEKVTEVFERAIKVLSRRENLTDTRSDEELLWQVNMDEMDFFFTSLVEYLQLNDAYNIFVLNPKRTPSRHTYGYRRGLSETEINLLKQDGSMRTNLLKSKAPPNPLDIEKIRKPLYSKHPMVKFAWTAVESVETAPWATLCLEALDSIEKSLSGKTTNDIVYGQAEQILHGKSYDIAMALRKELKSGQMTGIHPECLVDAWVGNDRWAFVDLSAGPFSWGPTVGGEGVRTETSLPNVEKTIGAVVEMTEEEAEDKFQSVIQEKFSVFGEDHHALDVLLAEMDIYELFAFKHCKGRKVKLALCEELDERMGDLKSEVETFQGEEYEETHKKKAAEALKRMEQWNLFSEMHEDAQNYTVARDSFLSHLGAVFLGSMRHIVAPSSAEGAFHYYETISFQLFFITQEKVKRADLLPVETSAIMQGLTSLIVPSQKLQFATHMLALSEDPALAMAFSIARRAATVPVLLVNGTYRSTVRSYLDSFILQDQLQRLSEGGSLRGVQSNSRSTLEVPVFWFIQQGEPLLIDKHYQAKALPDMVIVVQSSQSDWESHLQCNGQSLLWDLRNPIKAGLAAAAEHLAGLVPLHLTYSHAHENAIQDWIWSVGCNPFASTSSGWHTSLFQADIIARNYIITSLDESVHFVNSAIDRLLMERTGDYTFRAFRAQEHSLITSYNTVVSLWRRIAGAVGEMRYADSMRLLRVLEDASLHFVETTNATLAALHPFHCTRQRKVEVQFDIFDIFALSGFILAAAVLWFLLRSKRPKPKIN
ncbi:hypothetical protein SUGI_0145880 [Cryptomeria japonica]|uniref:uncharacterized protein LOC131033858 isoform X1 n=2 Tax=Cryptomeria japonica TaxID=3369 RepID=UPI0024089B9E|nr:uncharacterized protein LOC131033858 isoform X1 [Cryptomeria japonica]GLJ11188.1 hypothetical protein SUGI_0145880 [Cryptomeria japonica]